MGKEYRYMINEGLAFTEEKMMKKLSDRAKEGWLLEKATLMRFKLKKGEPENLIYSMDCNNPKSSDKEYFELFEKSGWTHVCSLDYIHFFSAQVGTVPIYTEKDVEIEKYKGTRKTYAIGLGLSIFALIIVGFIRKYFWNSIDNTIWNYVLTGFGMLAAGIGAPSAMVTVALYLRDRNAKKLCGKS